MKIVQILGSAIVAVCCLAAEPTWNPTDAVRKPSRTFAQDISSFIGRAALGLDQSVCRWRWLKSIQGLMPESAVSPTTYHFVNDRKNMRAGITRRFTPAS